MIGAGLGWLLLTQSGAGWRSAMRPRDSGARCAAASARRRRRQARWSAGCATRSRAKRSAARRGRGVERRLRLCPPKPGGDRLAGYGSELRDETIAAAEFGKRRPSMPPPRRRPAMPRWRAPPSSARCSRNRSARRRGPSICPVDDGFHSAPEPLLTPETKYRRHLQSFSCQLCCSRESDGRRFVLIVPESGCPKGDPVHHRGARFHHRRQHRSTPPIQRALEIVSHPCFVIRC